MTCSLIHRLRRSWRLIAVCLSALIFVHVETVTAQTAASPSAAETSPALPPGAQPVIDAPEQVEVLPVARDEQIAERLKKSCSQPAGSTIRTSKSKKA